MPRAGNRRSQSSSVTRAEAKQLVGLVQCLFEPLLNRYDEQKYPVSEYRALLRLFREPRGITSRDIERALTWKYGRKEIRQGGHAATVKRLSQRWESLLSASSNEERIQALKGPPGASDFVSRAFLVHLVSQGRLPIIDRFNHRAVRYLLQGVRGKGFELGHLPRSYSDIELVRSLIAQLRRAWRRVPPSPREIDRYLMVFGRNVAPAYRRMSRGE
jgi:hypothetical protein